MTTIKVNVLFLSRSNQLGGKSKSFPFPFIDRGWMRIADKMRKKLRTFGYLLCPIRAAIYWMQDATLIIHLQYSVVPGDSFSCKFFQNGLLR